MRHRRAGDRNECEGDEPVALDETSHLTEQTVKRQRRMFGTAGIIYSSFFTLMVLRKATELNLNRQHA